MTWSQGELGSWDIHEIKPGLQIVGLKVETEYYFQTISRLAWLVGDVNYYPAVEDTLRFGIYNWTENSISAITSFSSQRRLEKVRYM